MLSTRQRQENRFFGQNWWKTMDNGAEFYSQMWSVAEVTVTQ